MLEWVKSALSNKGEPSTKRLGVFLLFLNAVTFVFVLFSDFSGAGAGVGVGAAAGSGLCSG